MAISVVQTSSNNGDGGPIDLSGAPANASIFLMLATNTSATEILGIPSGWNQLATEYYPGYYLLGTYYAAIRTAVYYRTTRPTGTTKVPGASVVLGAAFSGVNQATPFDAEIITTYGGDTVLTSADLVTNVDNAELVYFGTKTTAPTAQSRLSVSGPTGFTNAVAGLYSNISRKTRATPSSDPLTTTTTGTCRRMFYALALKPLPDVSAAPLFRGNF